LIRGSLGLLLFLNAYKFTGISMNLLLTRSLKNFVQEIKNSDLVIGCGGGYLRTETSGISDILLLSVTCLNLIAGKYLKKPVYLYSQSIGPIHGKIQEELLKVTLNKANLIELREKDSLRYLQKLGIHKPMVITADPAFLLEKEYKALHKTRGLKKDRGLQVGITVRKWFKSQEKLDQYIKAIAQTIDFLVEKHDATVYYIPQVIAQKFGDDDRHIAFRVKKEVEHKDRYKIINKDLHPLEIIELCSKVDIFIGTRMHSNIFALISKTPVIAIEYEHKTRGIMRELGLEDLTINIKEANYTLLRKKIESLIKNRTKYVNLIEKNLGSQIRASERAIEVIRDTHLKDSPEKSAKETLRKLIIIMIGALVHYIGLSHPDYYM